MWPFNSISGYLQTLTQMLDQLQQLLLVGLWNLSVLMMHVIGDAIISVLPADMQATLASKGWFGGSAWVNLRTVGFALINILVPIKTFIICLLVILYFLFTSLVVRFMFWIYHNIPVFGGHK